MSTWQLPQQQLTTSWQQEKTWENPHLISALPVSLYLSPSLSFLAEVATKSNRDCISPSYPLFPAALKPLRPCPLIEPKDRGGEGWKAAWRDAFERVFPAQSALINWITFAPQLCPAACLSLSPLLPGNLLQPATQTNCNCESQLSLPIALGDQTRKRDGEGECNNALLGPWNNRENYKLNCSSFERLLENLSLDLSLTNWERLLNALKL